MARVAVLLVVVIAAALGGCTHGPVTQSPPQTAALEIDPRQQAIDERKDDLVRRIAVCESGDHGDSATEIYGGRGAYVGRLQFTRSTVINYVRVMEGRTITSGEAAELAHDYNRAAALAKFIIFELDGIRNWPSCAHKLGLAREVVQIKQM
jgi:hypothetical protein